MDNEGIGEDGVKVTPEHPGNTDCGVYSSFTTQGGNNVLWHPDRKTYLVGKRITAEFLSGLVAPEQ